MAAKSASAASHTSSTDLNAYVLTFNTARRPISAPSLAPPLFSALPSTVLLPDIIAISLQEVAPIAYSFLGGSYVEPYFAEVARTVGEATRLRLREHGDARAENDNEVLYRHLLTRHVGMTALLVFAKKELAGRIRWAQTAGTGVGLWQMGNKGAVAARIAFGADDQQHGGDEHVHGKGETEITFVAAHLAPHEANLEARNKDFEEIVRNLGFTNDVGLPPKRTRSGDGSNENEPLLRLSVSPSDEVSSLYDTNGTILFAGDLNYRTSLKPPSKYSHHEFPQPSHPEDSPYHYTNYFARDQLSAEMASDHAFHHFAEVRPISFPPTYKYNTKRTTAGTAVTASGIEDTAPGAHWDWAAHRFPSWCDRILYLPVPVLTTHAYTALPVQPSSDHRPVALSFAIAQSGASQVSSTSHSPATTALNSAPLTDGKRFEAPFPLDVASFKEKRAAARTREIVVGVLAYLALTREGNVVVGGCVVGAAVAWWLLSGVAV